MLTSDGRLARAPKPRGGRRLDWKVFGVLMLGALLGALCLLPYALTLTPALPPGGPPLGVLLIASTVQTLLLVAIAAAVGLRLGERIGLGAPLLKAWLAGDPTAPRRFVADLPIAVLIGVAGAVLTAALDLFVFAPRIPELQSAAQAAAPPLWTGLTSALYGAIDEEILLRLGLMTALVWVGTRLTRSAQPGAGVVWTANVATALLFGLGHLPATALIAPLTPLVILRAVVLNGLEGVAFGWLYWRRGLLAAMVAHFCADVVLHVLAPLLVGWVSPG